MGVIAGDKVVAFQAADAFGYRRSGEADFSANSVMGMRAFCCRSLRIFKSVLSSSFMALISVIFNLDDIITLKQAQKKHKSLKVRRKEDINLVYFMESCMVFDL